MEILVFKTNIRYKKNIPAVMPLLNNLKGLVRWNLDFHDADKILRVEASDLSSRVVENKLQEAGYYCEELME